MSMPPGWRLMRGRHRQRGGKCRRISLRNLCEGAPVMEIAEESPYRFVISRHGRMRVPGVVFATRALIPDPAGDRALQQVVNVAELPGATTATTASSSPAGS